MEASETAQPQHPASDDPSETRGVTPAIGLIDPKFPHNVGASVRAASCFGVNQVWFSGRRVNLRGGKGNRLPREERMRGFREVQLRQNDRFFDEFPDASPVAVELQPGAELLPEFDHPDRALYVFGPEDGHIPKDVRAKCHRFVVIPTRHCVNLAAAVYLILYDRLIKRLHRGEATLPRIEQILAEERAWSREDDAENLFR